MDPRSAQTAFAWRGNASSDAAVEGMTERSKSAGKSNSLELIALDDVPEVQPGDDVTRIVIDAVAATNAKLEDGDVVVIAQKIISKAEGRQVSLADVTPGDEAQRLADKTGKDPRLVQLVLDESNRVLRHRPNVLVVEHRLGFVHANAGIDQSNIAHGEGQDRALLLPLDSDASAAKIRSQIKELIGVDVGVIVNDSFGRAWRYGTVGHTIGSAGVRALDDLRGESDRFGGELQITEVAIADELAAAASYVMGQASEGCPVVLVRGAAKHVGSDQTVRNLLRDPKEDMFRD